MENSFQQKLYGFFVPFWSAETSYSPHLWSAENPALGQCVPTSLIINDYFGGDITRGYAHLHDGRNDSHYWNVIRDQKIDVTGYQYGSQLIQTSLKPALDIPVYDFLLQNADALHRYKILKAAIQDKGLEQFVFS